MLSGKFCKTIGIVCILFCGLDVSVNAQANLGEKNKEAIAAALGGRKGYKFHSPTGAFVGIGELKYGRQHIGYREELLLNDLTPNQKAYILQKLFPDIYVPPVTIATVHANTNSLNAALSGFTKLLGLSANYKKASTTSIEASYGLKNRVFSWINFNDYGGYLKSEALNYLALKECQMVTGDIVATNYSVKITGNTKHDWELKLKLDQAIMNAKLNPLNVGLGLDISAGSTSDTTFTYTVVSNEPVVVGDLTIVPATNPRIAQTIADVKSNPMNHKGHIPDPDNSVPASPGVRIGTGHAPLSVVASGQFVYVLDESGLQTFHVSEPAGLELKSTIKTGPSSGNFTPFSVAVFNGTAYVVDALSTPAPPYASIGGMLQTFNISDSDHPQLLGTTSQPDTRFFPDSIAVSGNFAYVVNSPSGIRGSLQIFDVTNPASPSLKGSIETEFGPISVAVADNYAYVANYRSNTLQVFDVTRPDSPSSVISVRTDELPYFVAVSEKIVYVVNYKSNTLQIFDANSPGSPSLIGSIHTENGPVCVAVYGKTAYVVNNASNTLEIFDVSTPSRPSWKSSIRTEKGPSSVTVSEHFVAVADHDSNYLEIFRKQ